jgi:hypothetical protein
MKYLSEQNKHRQIEKIRKQVVGIMMVFGKTKSTKIALVLFVFFSFIVITGCGQKKECEFNSDCTPQNDCYKATCGNDYKCANIRINNCCGNGICDYAKDENSNGENYCTCAADCGSAKYKCEGFKVLTDTKYGKTYTKILEYKCSEKNECILDFDRTAQRDVPLITEKQLPYFKLAIKTTLKKPFDVTKDNIEVEVELKDRSPDLSGPITITGVQILKGSSLYGSVDLNKQLKNISESFKTSIPITYIPESIESEQSLELKVEYSYSYVVDKKTGEIRTKNSESLSASLSEKLYMVKPGDKFVPSTAPATTTSQTGAAK